MAVEVTCPGKCKCFVLILDYMCNSENVSSSKRFPLVSYLFSLGSFPSPLAGVSFNRTSNTSHSWFYYV